MTIDKLISLKGWLTLDEAARELSTTLRRDVNHSDVYRLALDGHLALSVYIPVAIDAMCFGNDTKERPTQHKRIDGIWELPMIGAARREMESRCFPNISMDGTEGVIVQRDEERCQLPALDPSKWPFFRPSALPREASVVVRTAALAEFIAQTLKGAHEATARCPATWEDVSIEFISDLKVQVTVKTKTYPQNYAEMGFKNGKTKNPNLAWMTLKLLAEAGGAIPVAIKERKVVEKRMQEIRKTLRAHFERERFDLPRDSDPLPYDPEGKKYEAIFRIDKSPSFDA